MLEVSPLEQLTSMDLNLPITDDVLEGWKHEIGVRRDGPHTDPALFLATVAERDPSGILAHLQTSRVRVVLPKTSRMAVAQIEADGLLLQRAAREIEALRAKLAEVNPAAVARVIEAARIAVDYACDFDNIRLDRMNKLADALAALHQTEATHAR